MLVEFSVANFRSIKERQTLSFVSSGTSNKKRNILETGYNAAPHLLETCAIYGANGSGKTNLLRALEFFQEFVEESSKDKQHGEKIDITPFLFSTETEDKPSEFEVTFIHQGYLFQYGFTADEKRVYEEWLYATPQNVEKQKPQRWFERAIDDIENSFVRKELKGQKEQWKSGTRENALFLSTAVQLNSKDFKKPFEWIVDFLCPILAPSSLHLGFSAAQVFEGPLKKDIIHFMKGLDSHIADIIVKQRDLIESDFDGLPVSLRKEIMKDLKGKKHSDIYTAHKKDDGSLHYLDIDDESAGTRRLFAFAGPILDVLENGYTLIVDELHNSLHPQAMRSLVSLFENKKYNKNNAQLIFTTHDTNIMGSLDREQICFLEKRKHGETTVKALSEFKGDRSEAIEKRYLSGRYGALPNIGELI